MVRSRSTLVIYGAGFATNLRRARRRINLIVAILCLLVCIPSALNLVRALEEERARSRECDAPASWQADPPAPPPRSGED